MRHRTILAWLAVCATLAFGLARASAASGDRPNILWLVQEDMSPWLGCYGDTVTATPHMDELASRGVLFRRAFVPAPVCSSCRSGFIVGAPSFRFGAHHHRSRRGKAAQPLPAGMKTLPELFQAAGYRTFNLGKTDYNFTTPKSLYQRFPSFERALSADPNVPFFGQIQMKGGKSATKKFEPKTDPASVTVPADYPQNELFRGIVAQHYDAIGSTDREVGDILQKLQASGLADRTIVVMFSDHGAPHLVRHKQMPTEAGLHVPLIIAGPKRWIDASGVRDDLVSILDVSATTLAWAGIQPPDWTEGRDLFAPDFQPREFVGGARDRCDHTIDRARTIRTDRYRYTRNYLLDRVLLQPQYRDNRPYTKYLRNAYAAGTLPAQLAKIYFGARPAEELYDIAADPAQLTNLANAPAYKEQLQRHRRLLSQWLAAGDMAEQAQPEIELIINGNGSRHRGVNPEYETVRQDADGDGLSDRWERLNQRDPNDGRLRFEFDCGGWQTEGWETAAGTTNLAGDQGYLQFDLQRPQVVLRRSGLKLKPETNRGQFTLRVRATQNLRFRLRANGRMIGVARTDDRDWQEISLGSLRRSTDPITQLELIIRGPVGASLEMDWIRVQP